MKEYLGDGVYVQEWNNELGGVVLTTENGVSVTNTIYMEESVVQALLAFLKLK